MRGPELGLAATELQTEQDNLRAALAFTLASAQSEASLRLAVALSPFWELKGQMTEGRQALQSVLSLDLANYPLLRARALYRAGALSKENCEAASALLQEALRLA